MLEEVGSTSRQPARRKVFLSYAKQDRERVTAVKMLLEVGGADVFMDWCSIQPGIEWETALAQALVGCDVLCVFWSAAAQRSRWVAAEYTTFLTRYPERACVPLRGDATQLPAVLAQRQAPPEFLALADELCALRQHLVERGVSRREAQRIVRRRLAESGLELNQRQMSTLLGVFATGVSAGALLMPKLSKIAALIATLIVATWLVVWHACSREPGARDTDTPMNAAPDRHHRESGTTATPERRFPRRPIWMLGLVPCGSGHSSDPRCPEGSLVAPSGSEAPPTAEPATGEGGAGPGDRLPARRPVDDEKESIIVLAQHTELKPDDPVKVQFTSFKVTRATFDPMKLEDGKARIEVDATSLKSGNEKRDAHLNTPDFLDTRKFSRITVDIDKVRRKAGETYTAEATVRFRDVTKKYPVSFDVIDRTADSVRIHGEAVLSRLDFNVGKDSTNPREAPASKTLTVQMTLRLHKQLDARSLGGIVGIVNAVRDPTTREPATDARLVASSKTSQGDLVAITNKEGAYYLAAPAGVYTLTIYYNSTTYTKSNVLAESGKEVVVNIDLGSM